MSSPDAPVLRFSMTHTGQVDLNPESGEFVRYYEYAILAAKRAEVETERDQFRRLLDLEAEDHDRETERRKTAEAALSTPSPVSLAPPTPGQSTDGAEPAAWRGDRLDGTRKFTAIKRVAEIWEEQGQTVTPLYAAPQPPTDGRNNPFANMIYIASKVKHADRWRKIASAHPVSSSWIYEAGEGETTDFNDLWSRCLAEATQSKALVAYREDGETMKGAWAEIGAALSHGVPVHAVGLEDFTIGKFQGITHHKTMKDAVTAALKEPRRTTDGRDAVIREEAMEWHDLSSAPRDGSRILLSRKSPHANDHSVNRAVVIGRHYDEKNGKRRFVVGETRSYHLDLEFDGWMPLPAIRALAAAGGPN